MFLLGTASLNLKLLKEFNWILNDRRFLIVASRVQEDEVLLISLTESGIILYPLLPKADTIEEFLEEVFKDPSACFCG